jgi:uncharacterized protein involved in outer membrane biogenesis
VKRIFKWLLRLVLAAIVLVAVAVIVFLLSYNAILREVIIHRIRAQTGMNAEIGSFKLGLFSPTVDIRNFTLYNPPDFGGTPFITIPEIHAEYDRDALRRQEIHLTLLRFNLGELDIVKNQAGSTNIFLSAKGFSAQQTAGGNALAEFRKYSGFHFTGIDSLHVSVGEVKYIDLGNQQNNREQTIGIDDVIIPNVKSPTDLGGLALDVELHSNGFFDFLQGRQNSSADVLKQLGF